MTVKRWFLEKKFTQNEIYAIQTTDEVKVQRETEKAVLLRWRTDYGTIVSWIPKSCLEA